MKAHLDVVDSQRNSPGGRIEEGINLCITKHEMGSAAPSCGSPIISAHEVLPFLFGKVSSYEECQSTGDSALLQGWPSGIASETGI